MCLCFVVCSLTYWRIFPLWLHWSPKGSSDVPWPFHVSFSTKILNLPIFQGHILLLLAVAHCKCPSRVYTLSKCMFRMLRYFLLVDVVLCEWVFWGRSGLNDNLSRMKTGAAIWIIDTDWIKQKKLGNSFLFYHHLSAIEYGIRKSKHICCDLLSHRDIESHCIFLCFHWGQGNPVHLCMILFFFLFRFHKS